MAITNDQNLVLKIVAGLFNAAPGKSNFDALSSSLTSGSTPLQIAEALDSIPAFASTALGSATTTQAKVDALMSNFGLSVAGDLNPNSAASQAYAYFTQALNAGQSLGRIVFDAVTFLSGSVPAEFATTATLLSNKAAVAEHYSVTQGVSGATLADLQTVLSGVTATTDVSTPAALDAVIAKVTDSTAPVATAATFSFAENATTATVLGTVTATDNAAVTGFEIVSGNDSKFFAIDSAGKITLTEAGTKSAANDFETTPNTFTIGVKAVDAAGNKSEAVNTILNVTDVDDVAPTFVGATAAAGSNKVTVNFSEALKTGNPAPTAFTVKDGTTTVGVTSTAINGGAVTLTLASNVSGTVTVSYDSTNAGNKLQDAAGNFTANFDGKTASSDVTVPTLSSSTPIDGGSLAKADNIILNFSEEVVLGSGNVTIVNSGDSKDTRTIAINDAGQVSVSGTKVTINPTADLVEGGAYYINIPNTAILDKAGNAYVGISDSTTLNFAGAAATASTVQGQSFTLTTGLDTITGTAGNDTIGGAVSATAASNTLTAIDNINGGDGTDSLVLSLDTSYAGGATISNTERISVTGSAAVTFSMSGISGVKTLENNSSSNTLGFTNVGNVTDVVSKNMSANALTVTYTDAAVVGSSDVINLTLNNAQNTINLNSATADGSGIETLNVILDGAATTVATTIASNDTGIKTVNISGNQGISNAAGSAGLTLGTNITTTATTVNASSSTGGVTITGFGAANHTVTGGSGNDVFDFGGNFDTSDIVKGGDGTDEIISTIANLNTTAISKVNSNVSGIETIGISDVGGGTIDLSFFGAKNIHLQGGATTLYTVNNIASGGTIRMDAVSNVANVFNVTNATTPATADTVNIDLRGGAVTYQFTVGGVETINVNTANATGTSTLNMTDTSLQTLKLTGSNSVTIATTNLGANVSTLDASGLSGSAALVMTASLNASAATGANVTGSINADTVIGSSMPDVIKGDAGADTITGAAGADRITGGTGADTITQATPSGDSGTASGFAASGTVPTAAFSTSSMDIVTDFAVGDKIQLTGLTTSTTLLKNGGTLGAATAGDTILVRGTYSSSANTFTPDAAGADSAFVYDTNGTTAAGTYEAIVLIGYVDSGTADTISAGGLFTGVA